MGCVIGVTATLYPDEFEAAGKRCRDLNNRCLTGLGAAAAEVLGLDEETGAALFYAGPEHPLELQLKQLSSASVARAIDRILEGEEAEDLWR